MFLLFLVRQVCVAFTKNDNRPVCVCMCLMLVFLLNNLLQKTACGEVFLTMWLINWRSWPASSCLGSISTASLARCPTPWKLPWLPLYCITGCLHFLKIHGLKQQEQGEFSSRPCIVHEFTYLESVSSCFVGSCCEFEIGSYSPYVYVEYLNIPLSFYTQLFRQ